MNPAALIDEYSGIPFVVHGRKKETGLDCWGFIILVFEKLGISVPDFSEYDLADANKQIEWHQVDIPGLYDIVLFDAAGGHAGIYINNGHVIHFGKYGVAIVNITAGHWKKYIRGYWRHG